MPAKLRPPSEEKVKCACGHCDVWIPKYNNRGRLTTFAFGHSITKWKVRENPTIECGCGCKGTLLKYDKKWVERKFIMNHNKRKTVTKDKNYEYIYAPNHPFKNHRNKVYKHRLVAEEYLSQKLGLKIYLGRSILIHHIDENPHNNDISNLMIVTRASHMTIHKTVDMSDYFCLFCHSSETYHHIIQGYKWFDYNNGHICHSCYKRLNYDYMERKNKVS